MEEICTVNIEEFNGNLIETFVCIYAEDKTTPGQSQSGAEHCE